ncbi:MAG: hypothetical protein ACOC7Y_02200 [Chloroflexota bacterium]
MSSSRKHEAKQGKLTLSFKVHIERGRRNRLVEGDAPPPEPKPERQGTIPRVTRLLALAHHFQGMLDRGEVQSQAEIARLGHVTRARVTQIMNLLLLAPDIQEEILFLPPTTAGRDPLTEHDLRPLLRSLSFRSQRSLWAQLRSTS